MRNLAYIIFGGDYDFFLDTTLRTLRRHADCTVLLFTPGLSADGPLREMDNVITFPVPVSQWVNRRAFCKLEVANQLMNHRSPFALQHGDRLLAIDGDLLFKADPFLAFSQSPFDFFYTTRHYEYHYPVNAGVYGWVVNQRTRRLFDFWTKTVIAGGWAPYRFVRRWFNREQGNLDWTVGQDFVFALYLAHQGLIGAVPFGLRLFDASAKYNCCLPDCVVWERDGEKFLAALQDALRSPDYLVIHFKGKGKYVAPPELMHEILQQVKDDRPG